MNSLCLLCNNNSERFNLCSVHYNKLRIEYKKYNFENKGFYDVSNHYHNLRHSIIRLASFEHYTENAIKLMVLSMVLYRLTNNRDYVTKCTDFIKKQTIIKLKNIEANEEAKSKIISQRWDDYEFRKKWSAEYLCDDGHFVRSISEATIDNWLFNHLVTHAYEKPCVLNNEAVTILHPDFYIPEINTYIEYWGRYDKVYLSHKAAKKMLYKENEIDVINIESSNLSNINNFLYTELTKRGIKIKTR